MQRLVAILIGVAVSLAGLGLAAAERRQEKFRASLVEATRVDMGVTLRVVRKSPDGRKVTKATPANTIRTHHLGGMVQIGGIPDGWDRATMGDPPPAFYVGPSQKPVEWMCSEDQEALILHDGATPKWTLIQGSEGAGKSVVLVMWTALRVLEHVGRDVTGAITVPTAPRFRAVKKEARKLWPARWYRWKERDRSYAFHVGPSVQIVSAVQRSEESGSPLQGDSLEWCASDELQDHFSLEADIMSRGRGSDRYLRLCTSTSKDYSEWREFRDRVRASRLWHFAKLLGPESPFVNQSFWDEYREGGTVTDREFRRRVLAEDVGPERQVYYSWDRAKNLCRIPDGAVDVTAEVLKPWTPAGRRLTLLVGHDPGKRQHVSVFLKAYRLPRQAARDTRPRWFIVDEVTSPESTMQSHVLDVLARARSVWKVNRLRMDTLTGRSEPDPDSPQMLVRIDPHTRSGTAHPGQDVYTRWRQQGIDAKPAAYRPGSIVPMTIKVESRLDMMNTLLRARDEGDDGLRRLFVALDETGKAAAPKFVKAVESMERNEAGEAEAEAKDASDLSHWPCAVGYALWMIEAPRLKPSEAAA